MQAIPLAVGANRLVINESQTHPNGKIGTNILDRGITRFVPGNHRLQDGIRIPGVGG